MRTLSLFIVSLSLVATSAIAAPPGRGERPKTERERELEKDKSAQRDQAARDAVVRSEQNRMSEVAMWAGQNIQGFSTVKLGLALRTRPYTVPVVDSVSKVKTDYKPLVVSDLVSKIMDNAKASGLTAEKSALVKEAIVFASHFGKLYTGTDPVMKRAQDAAYRQLEALSEMTAPGFAEKKPNEISSTLEFLRVATKDATDSSSIADVYVNGIKKTRGEDPAILRMELEDIANCKAG